MEAMKGNVTAVVGGQYGSEGKGVVVHELARDPANGYVAHVRTGGPNAGHSFFSHGRVWKMQTVPCGWTNPDASICIGPGGVLSLENLREELDAIAEVDPSVYERLMVDHRCGILEPRHHKAEGGTRGELHQRIGSTGEGVGAARLDRIARDQEFFKQAADCADFAFANGAPLRRNLCDVPHYLDRVRASGGRVLLEGTQGFGLSLVHGEWPSVTSHDTTAAQLAADAGVPPHAVDTVVLVVRSMPIRVAGNSGQLAGETSWEALSERLGRPVEERTTVTKKVRRIGSWDEHLVERAIRVNGATHLVLTFADYIEPADHGVTVFTALSASTRSFVDYLERYFRVPVVMVGTGWSEAAGWTYCKKGVIG